MRYKPGNIVKQTEYLDDNIRCITYLLILGEDDKKDYMKVKILEYEVITRPYTIYEKVGEEVDWWLPNSTEESYRDMRRTWKVISQREVIAELL